MFVVVGLALVGFVVVVVLTVQVALGQTRAPAPAGAAPAPLPGGAEGAPAAVALAPSALLLGEMIRSVMPGLLSVVLLIPSSVVVLARDRSPEQQQWATAAISSILTYWLT
jgi:hypothetical protein